MVVFLLLFEVAFVDQKRARYTDDEKDHHTAKDDEKIPPVQSVVFNERFPRFLRRVASGSAWHLSNRFDKLIPFNTRNTTSQPDFRTGPLLESTNDSQHFQFSSLLPIWRPVNIPTSASDTGQMLSRVSDSQ